MREPLAAGLPDLGRVRRGRARRRGRRAAARAAWESELDFDREDPEPEHQLVLGGVLTFDELLAEPRARRRDGGWDPDEPRRFGRCAAGCGTACSREELDDR